MGRGGEQKAHDKSTDDSNPTLKRFFKVVGVVFDSIFFLTIGAIVGALAFYVYMDFVHSHLVDVRVPDVRGMSKEQAMEKLENSGLVPEFEGKVCGKVMGTYPRIGLKVRKGRKVEVYCLETSMSDLANMLTGIPFKYVADTLSSLGLKYEVSKIPFPGDDGKVLSAVYSNEKMYLLLDGGEPKKFFVVGDYRGKSLEKVESSLKKKKLSFSVEGAGKKVVDQFPKPGSVWNTVILITE